MSKGGNSTSTTVQKNPLGDAQLPYLTNMWGEAGRLGGWTGSGVGDPAGANYLDQIRGATQSNFNASYPSASNLVPFGNNFVWNALTGNANPYLPANSQTQDLTSMGRAAANTGQAYAGAIGNAAGQAPGTVAPWSSALGGLAGQYGGLTNAGYGALGQFGNLAGGALNVANPQEQALMANSGMAIAGNPAFSSGLMGLASGQYIDPSTNPALGGVLKSALDPITKQYQTATAPQTDSAFSGSGRYGSGAWQNAVGNNQYGLGGALSRATSDIVNNAYNTGLQTTLNAGSSLGQLFNQGSANQAQALQAAGQLGQGGYNLAGNLLGQGYGNLNSLGGTGLGGAANAYQQGGALSLSGLQAMMQGLGSAAGAANQGYGTGTQALAQGGNLANAGTLNLGGLAQMTPDLANYPLSQLSTAYNSIWAPIQNYAGILGPPQQGSTSTTQTTPYQSNVFSNVLGGALGIAKLAQMI